jgi:hypothetical protein
MQYGLLNFQNITAFGGTSVAGTIGASGIFSTIETFDFVISGDRMQALSADPFIIAQSAGEINLLSAYVHNIAYDDPENPIPYSLDDPKDPYLAIWIISGSDPKAELLMQTRNPAILQFPPNAMSAPYDDKTEKTPAAIFTTPGTCGRFTINDPTLYSDRDYWGVWPKKIRAATDPKNSTTSLVMGIPNTGDPTISEAFTGNCSLRIFGAYWRSTYPDLAFGQAEIQ